MAPLPERAALSRFAQRPCAVLPPRPPAPMFIDGEEHRYINLSILPDFILNDYSYSKSRTATIAILLTSLPFKMAALQVDIYFPT